MSENLITLERGEQVRLQKAVGQKVYSVARYSLSSQPQLFADLYHDIKAHFRVESYKYIKRQDLQLAIVFVDTWKPNKKATRESGLH